MAGLGSDLIRLETVAVHLTFVEQAGNGRSENR